MSISIKQMSKQGVILLLLSIVFLSNIFIAPSFAATKYGEGKYGAGKYNIGPTSTPTISPTQSPDPNPGQQGRKKTSSQSWSCSSAKPGSAPDIFQINAQRNSATLYFAPSLSPRDRYVVSYGTSAGEEEYAFEFVHDSSGVIAVDVSDLQSNTAYYFRARAGNGCMPGDWSNELAVRTGQRFPSYRWTSLPRIVATSVTRTINPSSINRVDSNNLQPFPTPSHSVQKPTKPSPPESTKQVDMNAQQSSQNIFQRIGNFFRNLFGR